MDILTRIDEYNQEKIYRIVRNNNTASVSSLSIGLNLSPSKIEELINRMGNQLVKLPNGDYAINSTDKNQ